MKHGFKVLTRVNRKLMSFVGGSQRIRYMIGKPSRPKSKCGPLAVFKDRKDAQVFADRHAGGEDYTIRPCTYRPSRTRRLWYFAVSSWTLEWRKKEKTNMFPPGTDFASVVIVQKGKARR